ncbi:MAG TPA: DHH family phosphoesterase, partial [Nitrosopumilaceae archaeon]|nr:DHH family phosphoesterase [Nitrosopumilaceae archaeon]
MMSNLEQSLSYFQDKIFDCIKSNKSIFVLTHIDCDGLGSGSIITKALIRAGANCTVRTTKELNKSVISNLKKNSRDLHVITDLGGGFAKELDESLSENWIVLDHHEIPKHEYENERVINAWKFGINGGTEICAGGMAYLAANSLDNRNVDLSPIAIVAA